jgi:hypothetical protein
LRLAYPRDLCTDCGSARIADRLLETGPVDAVLTMAPYGVVPDEGERAAVPE